VIRLRLIGMNEVGCGLWRWGIIQKGMTRRAAGRQPSEITRLMHRKRNKNKTYSEG
jgi:hypothetical protein